VSNVRAAGYTKVSVTFPDDGPSPDNYELDLGKLRQSGSALEIPVPAEELPVTLKSGVPTVVLEVRLERESPSSTRWSEHHIALNVYLEVEIPAAPGPHGAKAK